MKSSFAQQLSSGLVGKVIYPLWTIRDHPTYLNYAKAFARDQYLSPSRLEAVQIERLRIQLTHAYKNIPFYRRRMEKLGITPFDITSLSDFKKFPVVTKQDVQNHKPEMMAQNIPEKLRVRNQSGGSTGIPLQFWVDKERFDSRRASTDRHNSWAGLRPGDWCAQLWGAKIDVGDSSTPRVTWRQRMLHRMLPLNTVSIGPNDLNAYIEILRRYRPRHMVAYAQSAVMFARHCAEVGADDIRFDSMITTAEILRPEDRAFLEETFRGKVFNRYGCREISVLASECEYHTGMHVNADALILEIEPVAGASGNMGRVLVTDLFNRSMPLIRYEIGDMASWSEDSPCPCGRSLPRLANIDGRVTDFLRLPDGTLLSGIALATLVIADLPGLRQVQFVQRGATHVHLNVVAIAGQATDAVDELKRRLNFYLRDTMQLSTSLVDSIPCEASGKFRFVKTELQTLVA